MNYNFTIKSTKNTKSAEDLINSFEETFSGMGDLFSNTFEQNIKNCFPTYPTPRRESPFPTGSIFDDILNGSSDIHTQETKEGLLVEIDLPGVKKETLEVTMTAQGFIATGKRSSKGTEKTVKRVGTFDANKYEVVQNIEATYDLGVLSFLIPNKLAKKETEVKVSIK